MGFVFFLDCEWTERCNIENGEPGVYEPEAMQPAPHDPVVTKRTGQTQYKVSQDDRPCERHYRTTKVNSLAITYMWFYWLPLWGSWVYQICTISNHLKKV